jgi:hypothetical protein
VTPFPKSFGHSIRYYPVSSPRISKSRPPVPSDQECAMLGSASDSPLRQSNLQQLPLRGLHNRVFGAICGVGHALSPRIFSIDSDINQYNIPPLNEDFAVDYSNAFPHQSIPRTRTSYYKKRRKGAHIFYICKS